MTEDPEYVIDRARAEAILEDRVRGAIRGHGGDIHIIDISEQGDITVEFAGACRACPLRPVTFGTAVLPAFDGIAGVRSVRCDSIRVSSHAVRRLAQLFGRVA
jgi:Fe-S cluster biogenesis protein NfuA